MQQVRGGRHRAVPVLLSFVIVRVISAARRSVLNILVTPGDLQVPCNLSIFKLLVSNIHYIFVRIRQGFLKYAFNLFIYSTSMYIHFYFLDG